MKLPKEKSLIARTQQKKTSKAKCWSSRLQHVETQPPFKRPIRPNRTSPIASPRMMDIIYEALNVMTANIKAYEKSDWTAWNIPRVISCMGMKGGASLGRLRTVTEEVGREEILSSIASILLERSSGLSWTCVSIESRCFCNISASALDPHWISIWHRSAVIQRSRIQNATSAMQAPVIAPFDSGTQVLKIKWSPPLKCNQGVIIVIIVVVVFISMVNSRAQRWLSLRWEAKR